MSGARTADGRVGNGGNIAWLAAADTDRATPPGGQWQCQGRNGTGSVTAFEARGGYRASTRRRFAGSADPAVEPSRSRRTVDRRGTRAKIACKSDRIYVTRRAFGRDCTSARRRPPLSPTPPLSFLSLSLSLASPAFFPSRSPASGNYDERERECARALLRLQGIILRRAHGHVVERAP